MKRLSVRLSVIGTVLALGAAAITYSVLSTTGDAPENEDQAAIVAAPDAQHDDGPSPIRVERTPNSEISPAAETLRPPASMFGGGSVRTVRHDSTADATESAKLAAAIPTVDTADTGGGFPIPEPAYGISRELPEAVVDASSADIPPMPSSAQIPVDPNSSAYAVEQSGTLTDPTVDSENPLSDPRQTPESTAFASTRPDAHPASTPVSAPNTSAAGSSATVASPPTPPAPSSYAGSYAGVANDGYPREARTDSDGPDALAERSRTADDSRGLNAPPDPPGGPLTPVAMGAVTGAGFAGGYSGSGDGQIPPAAESAAPSMAGAGPHPAAAATNTWGHTTPAQPGSSSGAYVGNNADGNYGSSPTMPPSVSLTDAPPSTTGPTNLLASNVPGDRQLEGQQAPSIAIEKSAPEEIQVNRKATFQVRVRNNGNAPAHNVMVVDRVPAGTQFVDATPVVTPTVDGAVVWQIETLGPGEEVVLSMTLLPQRAGEIGSVAQATFQACASVRTMCTQPELKLDVAFPEQVLIGQPATMEIKVTNIGNGAADKVVIEEDVPEGFTHAAGRQLEHELGTLRPQEARRLTLVLESAKPGTYDNRMTVRGEGDLFDEDVRSIAVTAPQLQVGMQGPSLRYLDRQATYSVQLANPGTASARNVELVTFLPKGMKYVTSDNQGQYDTQTHAVYWSLEELPANKQGDVHVTVLPIEPGDHKLKTDARAELGLQEACEHEVQVEGLAELSFVVSDVADPIEVGSETTYEVTVRNRGSKADTDIQLVAQLPPGITPTTGDGPTQGTVQGQQVLFGPLARLGPGEEAVFKIHARGAATGDHVMCAQLRSAELRVPVTKEEITRVYTDN